MFKSYDMRGFGSYVRGVRKSLNYTQKDVESLTGLSCESIRKIESGLVVPRYDTLEFLSQAYKTDILNVFSLFRSSKELFDFYSYLDKIIVENNQEKMTDLIGDFDEVVCEKTTLNLINLTELKQFKLIIKGIKDYFDEESDDDGLSNFLAAMKLSIQNFEIGKIESYKYSRIELRILLLCSLSYSEKNNFDESNKLLLRCLQCSADVNRLEKVDRLMIIKILFNLSYNYHGLDDFDLSLQYANKGIEYCLKYHLNYLLPGLYYRSGIAKFRLKQVDFKIDLRHSINLLLAFGNGKLASLYKDIAMERYNIEL